MGFPEKPEDQTQKQHLQERYVKYTTRRCIRVIPLPQSRGAGHVRPRPPQAPCPVSPTTLTRKHTAQIQVSHDQEPRSRACSRCKGDWKTNEVLASTWEMEGGKYREKKSVQRCWTSIKGINAQRREQSEPH